MLSSEDDSSLSTDHLLGKTGRLVNEYNILGFLGSGGFGSGNCAYSVLKRFV